MSKLHLDTILKPQSIALIGASQHQDSLGYVIAKNLLNAGYQGTVMPVNPKYKSIEGVLCYPDLKALPLTPEMAVIVTPPKTVPGLVKDLAQMGTKLAIVVTAGFGEGQDEKGQALAKEVLAATGHKIRVLGPNCLGLIMPHFKLNASFLHTMPQAGNVALISQSGAVVTAMVDWAKAHDIGFSTILSLGTQLDIDFSDVLEHLADDPQTETIVLYIEALKNPEKFIKAAKAITHKKPILAIKAGRHQAAVKAVLSHTGSMAGSDAIYDAMFDQTGIVRVDHMRDVFEALQTIEHMKPTASLHTVILTNGGGVGIMAADSLQEQGGQLTELSQTTIKRLDKILPEHWSHANPIDILGDASAQRYAQTLDVLLNASEVENIILLNCPTALTNNTDVAVKVIQTITQHKSEKNVLAVWMGGHSTVEAQTLFRDAKIPYFSTPHEAIKGLHYVTQSFRHHVHYNAQLKKQNHLSAFAEEPFNRRLINSTIKKARREARRFLTEVESQAVLKAAGIKVVETTVVKNAKAAGACVVDQKSPVALKVLSKQISHKSDFGGVQLNLQTEAAVVQAANDMFAHLRKTQPNITIDGFVVQPMVKIEHGFELIVGVHSDAHFGRVLMVGHGGIAAELINDKRLALPPLNTDAALTMIKQLHLYRQMQGFRDKPPVDLVAVADTLVRLDHLTETTSAIKDIEINPLVVDQNGVVALDARITLSDNDSVDLMNKS